ncbi:MAG: hypothetical protein DYG89_44185 [Caldilinea sp. CFX5]|nr:hypothetical protein [Caldilinea sp. CFX5]
MKHNILVTKVAGNGYVARPVQWPEVVASGEDEAEAIAAVRQALAQFLSSSRIVQIELPATDQPSEDPWLQFAGMWSAMPDEQWDRFQASIAEARELMDQQQELMQTEPTA